MHKTIGIDLDNTIICYDNALYTLALEKNLITKDIKNKINIKNYIIKNFNENTWTELQGLVYGPEIYRASLYPGVLEFINKNNVIIISHKTKYPYLGEKYDLHWYALDFLKMNIPIFFEKTLQDKINKIHELCDFFIDDLPSVLSKLTIPNLLFDPHNVYNGKKFSDWSTLSINFR